MTSNSTSLHTLASKKTVLTFNVFFREDTSSWGYLRSVISKNPEHWAFFRSIFQGEKECSLRLVDKSIETPFHCLLAVLFCKQLESEMGISLSNLCLILTPLPKEHPGKSNTANMPFDTTRHRNDFLRKCFQTILGKEVNITTKMYPIHCRDLKISSRNNILFIRCEGGITNGWRVGDGSMDFLSESDLLYIHEWDMPCHNIFTHGYSKNGVFFNFDLQSSKPSVSSFKQ
jgi:hypothetical protein